jgi:hypothetical protein
MAKSREDPVREERIQDEAIVDAYYGPEEQAMSWYYYLENKIQFQPVPIPGQVYRR